MNNLPAVKEQALTQREFTPAQLTLLKNTLARGTSDDEFKLFLAIADRKGLDPFKKQIYAIMYGGKMAVVSAIDGYRAIAERTKEHGGTVYAGQDLPIWGPDVNGHPEWADVTVYRIVQGIRVPFPARAWWKDYGKVQRTVDQFPFGIKDIPVQKLFPKTRMRFCLLFIQVAYPRLYPISLIIVRLNGAV